jgi:hypothetical protein
VAGLLTEAEGAVAAGQCDLALGFYAEALRLDPANERARVGRDFCANARQAPAPAPRSGRTLVAGTTRQEGQPARRGPAGFEDSAGVAVRRIEQATSAPGKIVFEVQPAEVGPGDRFSVRVSLVNEGARALDVRQVTATTTVNGRQASGPLSAPPRPIAPGEKVTLLALQDVWKAEVTAWSLSVSVRLVDGEVYANELSWK